MATPAGVPRQVMVLGVTHSKLRVLVSEVGFVDHPDGRQHRGLRCRVVHIGGDDVGQGHRTGQPDHGIVEIGADRRLGDIGHEHGTPGRQRGLPGEASSAIASRRSEASAASRNATSASSSSSPSA